MQGRRAGAAGAGPGAGQQVSIGSQHAVLSACEMSVDMTCGAGSSLKMFVPVH